MVTSKKDPFRALNLDCVYVVLVHMDVYFLARMQQVCRLWKVQTQEWIATQGLYLNFPLARNTSLMAAGAPQDPHDAMDIDPNVRAAMAEFGRFGLDQATTDHWIAGRASSNARYRTTGAGSGIVMKGDYVGWREGRSLFSCRLRFQKTLGGDAPYPAKEMEYHVPVHYSLADMRLHAAGYLVIVESSQPVRPDMVDFVQDFRYRQIVIDVKTGKTLWFMEVPYRAIEQGNLEVNTIAPIALGWRRLYRYGKEDDVDVYDLATGKLLYTFRSALQAVWMDAKNTWVWRFEDREVMAVFQALETEDEGEEDEDGNLIPGKSRIDFIDTKTGLKLQTIDFTQQDYIRLATSSKRGEKAFALINGYTSGSGRRIIESQTFEYSPSKDGLFVQRGPVETIDLTALGVQSEEKDKIDIDPFMRLIVAVHVDVGSPRMVSMPGAPPGVAFSVRQTPPAHPHSGRQKRPYSVYRDGQDDCIDHVTIQGNWLVLSYNEKKDQPVKRQVNVIGFGREELTQRTDADVPWNRPDDVASPLHHLP
ncbi:hypothetical protein BDW74DRAFT_183277 [Aspergillus multicolor]|uniref:uncharacterized protein n=1 Tax=Aspergillus multicolor TaxID=41759 RepID=UPI003CCD997B